MRNGTAKICSIMLVTSFLVSITTGLASASPHGVPIHGESHSRVVFFDDFDGTTLNPVWQQRGAGYAPQSHLRCSKPSMKMVSVSNGAAHLQLRATVKKPKGCERAFLHAQISTELSQHFTYGVFTARIKFSPSRGAIYSFWLQSPVAYHEVDAVENSGATGPCSDSMFTTYAGQPGQKPIRRQQHVSDCQLFGDSGAWYDSYHTYTVKWTKHSYRFYVDDMLVHIVTRGVGQAPAFIILSTLGFNGTIDEAPSNSALAAGAVTMDVDYVKVSQR